MESIALLEEAKLKTAQDDSVKGKDDANNVEYMEGILSGHMISDAETDALMANTSEIIKVFTIAPYLIGSTLNSVWILKP